MSAAVAEIKTPYPHGSNHMHITIEMVSDKAAKDLVTIGNQSDAQLGVEQATGPIEKNPALVLTP